MPNPIRALLFDLDDTLYSRNAAFRRWAQAFVCDDAGLAVDDPRYREAVERIIDLDEWGYSPRKAFFGQIKEDHHLSQSVDQLYESYRQRFLDHMRAEEETQLLLATLKEAGVPFGIITNGATSRQGQKIRFLGLDQLTSCIFISEHFGCEKPDSAIFLAAATCLGHEPGDILFVGDNPWKDICGARQAGMQTAWLRHQRTWPAELAEMPPDYIISSLREVWALLNGSSEGSGAKNRQ